MGTNNAAERYLGDLGRELGQGDLTFGADGAVTLVLTCGIGLELRTADAGQAILLEAPLGGSGSALPDSFLRRCLAGNFLWLGTRGATLLTKPGGGLRFYLRQRLDLAATGYAEFRAAVERFLNTALSWQRACLAAGDGVAPEDEPAVAARLLQPLLIIRG